MLTVPAVPLRRSIDLASAARLELGLLALERGDIPGAAGALAAIDDDSWSAILLRLPHLPTLIEKGSRS
jgi:hypothetical protein